MSGRKASFQSPSCSYFAALNLGLVSKDYLEAFFRWIHTGSVEGYPLTFIFFIFAIAEFISAALSPPGRLNVAVMLRPERTCVPDTSRVPFSSYLYVIEIGL